MSLFKRIIYRLKRMYEISNIKKHILPSLGSNKLHCPKRIANRMIRLGFSPDCYYLYNLKENNYKDYITEVDRFLIREKINNGYNSLVTNKSIFFDVISKMAKTPNLYFRVIGCKIYDSNYQQLDKDIFLKRISGWNKVHCFVKPTFGYRGKNASIISFNPCCINGVSCSQQSIYDFLCSYNDCVVVETLTNAEYAKKIAPNSLNTIRIVTFKENQINDAKIAFAIHRFGGGGIVDNAADESSVFAKVDLNSNRLGIAKSHYSLNLFSKHPVTGEQIENVYVDGFEQAKQKVCELHNMMPYFDILGWDIALCNDGPFVIEANAMSDVDFAQSVCGGLQKSEFGLFIQRKLKI